MTQRHGRGVGQPGRRARHIGIIDIGSNSIRLVVFDGLSRIPHPLFNEKVLCGLGRSLERTGKLNPDGAVLALDNLARFSALAKAMDVRRLRVVGTAAVRDAEDGRDFVAEVKRRAGLRVEVLDGGEEARLSALGVLSGIPTADGVTGDLGGGSLELVRIDRGAVAEHDTLPFGPLRLREIAEKGRGKLRDLIDDHLASMKWLNKAIGRDFYAVGGAWRAIARLHMAHTGYPLHIIHHYAIKRSKAEEFLDLVAGLSRESLERLTDAPRRRLEALPLAAMVLSRILRRTKPDSLIFSAMGLREGCLFDELKQSLRRLDPLLAACEEVGASNARFPVDGRTLLTWIEPILKRANAAQARLRLAACYLSDIAWSEHPDYRADIAFQRVLRMPLTGIGHPGRAFLALSVFTRYDGAAEGDVTRPAWLLLKEDELREAYLLGLGLRLAYTLSGGTDLLRRVKLRADSGALRLVVPSRHRSLIGEAVERRLDAIARALDRKAVIKVES
jgi:exopolyphosphatase / guanosine-5'-triphosphate,3'-diphosphate pyrophosphatase